MNYLDTLLDGIEKNVVDQVKEAAAAALEEYPGQNAPIQAIQPAEWDKAPQAVSFWRLYNVEAKKEEFRDHLDRIAAEKAGKDRSVAALLRRAEEVESALQEFCERLLNAPDPLPYLNEGLSAQEHIKELRKENMRLQKDTKAAEKEATSAVTVVAQAQKAEAARAELSKLLEEESARVAALQAELADTGNLRFQCTRQEVELAQARAALSAVQAEYQRSQNELFELRNAQYAVASAKAEDAEMSAREYEQALARIRQLEHEVQRSNQRLQDAIARQDAAVEATQANERERALYRDVQRLQTELHRLRQAEENRGGADGENWIRRLQEAERQVDGLQAELGARLSVEEARELQERLQTAEALLDAQMVTEPTSESAGTEPGSPSPTKSLISTLQARNRRLVADNNSLRQRAAEAESESAHTREDLHHAMASNAEQEALIKQLEEDLQQSTGALNGGQEHEAEQPTATPRAREMLQIVTSQRDRYRKRIEEAEAETELCKKELSGAQMRCTGLEKDNLGLYERCRYMERCFQTQQASTPATAAYKVVNVDEAGIPHPTPGALSHRVSCGPFQLQLGGQQAVRSRSRGSRMSCLGRDEPDEETGPKTALEQRYSKIYENKINPFSEFQAVEREGRLPSHERALLTGSKVLLSNRAGRVFAVVYLLALHVFLFFLVYYIIVASTAGHVAVAV